jgi:hypothetical protein
MSIRRSRLVVALAGLAALAVAGCNEDPGESNGEAQFEPAPLPASSGNSPAYPPAAAYGLTQSSVINDFAFQGFVDPQAERDTLQPIHLSDFYNPHYGDASYMPASPAADDRLFPPGSLYGAGTKKPTALLIDIASVWCGPCNEEAKSLLNGLYARYKPCGGEFFFQLAEGAAPGTPATEKLLQTWTQIYVVAYPSIVDPAGQLGELYAADSFPDSAIVDTTTMKITDVISGVADATFWNNYEALLDPSCLAASP